MLVPRTMASPSVRFSSASTIGACEAPGAAWAFVALRFTRRNSSVSARTRFMCYFQVRCVANSHSDTYLIESKHLPGHLTPVIQSNSHPVVDLVNVRES
jgi:hypothetical protein